MGTALGTITARGKSMNEAYREACQDAENEYGHKQGYSGHINCTYGIKRDMTREYNAAKNKNAFIDDLYYNIGSGECYGVILEKPKSNINKVKSSVEITPQKGTKQWETRYVVEVLGSRDIASEKTQGAAIKKAREHCEKTQDTCRIHLTKVLVKGVTHVATVRYKQSKTQKDGKYLFIYAAKD